MKKVIALLGITILMFSCNVSKQVTGLYALTQCRYIFQSITNLIIAGINMQNVKNLSSLSPLDAANLLASFGSPNGSLPLSFTLNLDVTNPGVQTALMNGANYILEIDGMQMTQGSIDKQVQIASGKTVTMPITLGFDLKKMMSGQSLDAMKNMAFNLAGIGTSSSNLTVKLKPNLVVDNSVVSVPDYIPISFTLNKK